MFDVGVVGRNVGNEVRVASLLVGVDVGLFSKSVGFGCTLVVDVPKVGVGASLESEDAEEACPLVWTLCLIDDDVGSTVGLVGYADGTSKLRSFGRLAAIGMWPLGDVGG